MDLLPILNLKPTCRIYIWLTL